MFFKKPALYGELLYCILCNSSLHKFFQSTFLMKSMEPWHCICMFFHTFNSITLTKYNKLIEYKSVYCTIFFTYNTFFLLAIGNEHNLVKNYA